MVLWPGGFESFQSKESDDPCLVFFSDKEHMSLFSFKPLRHLLHTCLVLVCQRQKQASSPTVLEFAHFCLDIVCQGIVVRQSS